MKGSSCQAHGDTATTDQATRTSLGMQPDSCTPPAVLLFCEDGFCHGSAQDFAELLPTEMSVRIFSELDTTSLCSASVTCRRWNHIIEGNEQLWRNQCRLVRTVCQREVDGDRQEGLPWKVVLVRNYTRSRVKSAWLKGQFSCIHSADELLGRVMVPLDAESWGEILQAELDR